HRVMAFNYFGGCLHPSGEAVRGFLHNLGRHVLHQGGRIAPRPLNSAVLTPCLQGLSPALRWPDFFLRQVAQGEEAVKEASAPDLRPSVHIKRRPLTRRLLEPYDEVGAFPGSNVDVAPILIVRVARAAHPMRELVALVASQSPFGILSRQIVDSL